MLSKYGSLLLILSTPYILTTFFKIKSSSIDISTLLVGTFTVYSALNVDLKSSLSNTFNTSSDSVLKPNALFYFVRGYFKPASFLSSVLYSEFLHLLYHGLSPQVIYMIFQWQIY